MSRHIYFSSIFFDQVEGNGVVITRMAKFKKKAPKLLKEADFDGVSLFLGAPSGVVMADVPAHPLLVGLGRPPVQAFFGGVVDLVAEGLTGCDVQFLQVFGVFGIVQEGIGICGEGGDVFGGCVFFVRRIGAEEEGRDQPGFHSPWKGLAHKEAFAFCELIIKETFGQEGEWVVHALVRYKKSRLREAA